MDETPTALLAALRSLRKLAVLVIGLTVVAVGVALIFLPGPAFVVIPLGLALLSTEFLWARKLLKAVQARIRRAAQAAMGQEAPDGGEPRLPAWLDRLLRTGEDKK